MTKDKMVRSGEITLFSDATVQDVVLLFHGMTSSPREMEELASFLHSNGLDCFAPRLSGHDTTIQELAQTPLKNWIQDAENALDRVANYKRVHVIGQSFGALLALHLLLTHQQRCTSAVLLSLPWNLRSVIKEILLGSFTFAPDSWLQHLGYKKKKHRDGVQYRSLRQAYTQHSIAAATRIVVLRRALRQKLQQSVLSTPTLLLHDPLDHHLVPDSVWNFRKDSCDSPMVKSRWLYGGYHELTLGPCYEEIERLTLDFIRRGVSDAA